MPSVLVVETATVSELFGSSLAIAWAPAVLASFGSGTGAITVRVVAPHGAAAYQAALNADLANRKTSGAALLNDSQVAVSAAARSQLLAGQVDLRLLLALAWVAGHEPIFIVRFGNLGPGASPHVPLGFADLAESIPAAHMDTAAYARAVWAVLDGSRCPDPPRESDLRALSGPGHPPGRVRLAEPARKRRLGIALTALLASDRSACHRSGAQWSGARAYCAEKELLNQFGGPPSSTTRSAACRVRAGRPDHPGRADGMAEQELAA